MNHRNAKILYAVILAALVALAGLIVTRPARAQQTASNEVIVLQATGPIVPAFSEYIQRGLREAQSRNAEAVILMLDTPGGNLNDTLNIIQAIRNSNVPVIVFVGPRGAGAASAGLLVTLAGHASAMAPDTAIGATSPVGPQGQDLPSTEQQKVEQYVSAEARSLAERRGSDAVTLANDAVTQARAVSASEALQAHLVDFSAENVDDLLQKLDGFQVEVNGQPRTLHTAGATQTTILMSQLERVLMLLTDPNVVFLLLSIGVTAIIFEIRTPGGWIPGVIGVTSVGFALYGLGVLPVNWLGLVFIVMAFILFIVDVKAPTHGALTAGGVISMAVGAIILFSQPAIAPYGHLSIPLVVVWSLIIGGIFFFLVMMAVRAQKLRPTTGYDGLIGQVGRVTETLDPDGLVFVWGERWRAESVDRQPIPAGTEVEVVEAQNMRLRVRRRSQPPEAA